MGYQCPVTLDNGKPCSGRITATHPCQPLNQKKKQKRVEAAAAAAAAPKPKLSAPKAKTAEVEAEAGRSSSSSRTQVANTAAAGMADDAAQQGNWEDDGTRVRQSPPPQHDVVGGGMEDSDTHPFLRYAREVSNIERDAVAAPSGGMAEWHAELLETVRSIGSSPRSPATAAAAGPTALLDPTAPDIDDMEDPVIAIDQLFANEEGVIAVLDADGNYIELESVHGASPELIGFDYGAAAGVVTWYVAIRLSTLRKAMHVAGVVNRGPFGKAAEADSFLEPTASVYDTQQLSLPYSRPDDGFGAATADGGQQAEAVDSSMYEQGADLDHLIALCSLPPDLLGPLPESQSSSFPYAAMGHPPMYQQGGLPDMTGLQGSHSAGYIAEAPAQQAAEADVNGLLELLRV
ncbi:hypothetical protein PLESTF_000850600 [Pleodorina starrii]|nr:hypothetical protein PLESTF_000850600 [Pleodorina starrii]